MRSDWPLIRHLAKTHGEKVARAWQRLPLIEIPPTTTKDGARLRAAVADAMAAQDDGDLHWPFDDFVLDLYFSHEADSDDTDPWIHCWIRIVRGDLYLARRELLSPWDTELNSNWRRILPSEVFEERVALLRRSSMVTESWMEPWAPNEELRTFEQRAVGRIEVPSDQPFWGPSPTGFAYFPRDGRWDIVDPLPTSTLSTYILMKTQRGTPTEREVAHRFMEEHLETDGWWSQILPRYLTICPEYLVEVEPTAPPRTRRKSRPNPKAWTDNGLRRIILLEPTKAPSGDRSEHQDGSHASPRPHQRRGHWAQLRHPKYRRNEDGSFRKVFVKPAWVGPREWVTEGNRYRVIDQDVRKEQAS